MAKNFNLGVVEDHNEDLLGVVPEEVTNGKSWEQEQECITEEEAREKATSGEEKELPRKFTMKSLGEAFADLNKLLKKLRTWSPTL